MNWLNFAFLAAAVAAVVVINSYLERDTLFP